VGQAGAGNHDRQVPRRAHRSGQMSRGSRRITGAEPGGSPSRNTATTLANAARESRRSVSDRVEGYPKTELAITVAFLTEFGYVEQLRRPCHHPRLHGQRAGRPAGLPAQTAGDPYLGIDDRPDLHTVDQLGAHGLGADPGVRLPLAFAFGVAVPPPSRSPHCSSSTSPGPGGAPRVG
jgi:hypothetical protein